MSETNVKSPLVPNGDCKLIMELDNDKIIEQYKNDIGIQVDRFFDANTNIRIYECITSGYRFYYPFSAIGDGPFYEDLSSTKKNYYVNRWEQIQALNFINKTDQILEIGCGYGAFLELLSQNGYSNTEGLELNPLAVQKCKDKGFKVTEEFIEDVAESGQVYDTICSFQVLEHVTDVYSFIEASTKALRKGGTLIIGVPNNNPFLHINDIYHTLNVPPHHAGLWSGKSLSAVSKVLPLKMKSLQYEPLACSINYFTDLQIKNQSNRYVRFLLRKAQQHCKKKLYWFLSKFVKGRNVFVVFEKI